MSGYTNGVMSVELYKGEWILRACQKGDKPVNVSKQAQAAMRLWEARNIQKFQQ